MPQPTLFTQQKLYGDSWGNELKKMLKVNELKLKKLPDQARKNKSQNQLNMKKINVLKDGTTKVQEVKMNDKQMPLKAAPTDPHPCKCLVHISQKTRRNCPNSERAARGSFQTKFRFLKKAEGKNAYGSDNWTF